jgi:hypothetical protein
MSPLEGVGLALLAAIGVGCVAWLIIKYVERGLPGYGNVDAKTRMMDKYMEKTKQGMK